MPAGAHRLTETVEDVFEALLAEWRDLESAVIDEQFGEPEATRFHQEADREMEAWRTRFRSAVNW